MSLKTNYQDSVLDSSKNIKQRFNMTSNDDGTVSFEDTTAYSQTGSSFGAEDINSTNQAVNDLKETIDNLELVASKVTYDSSDIKEEYGMEFTNVQDALDTVVGGVYEMSEVWSIIDSTLTEKFDKIDTSITNIQTTLNTTTNSLNNLFSYNSSTGALTINLDAIG